MKIRIGFVSNSSSSSFVIVGKQIAFSDIKAKDIKNIYIKGKDFDEGFDIFNPDKELFNYLKKSNTHFDFIFFKAFKTASEGKDKNIKSEDLKDVKENWEIFIFERSNHSTKNVVGFMQYYEQEEE